MKQEHEHVISRIMEVEPIVINSALLSAQNRVRLYWTNIYNEQVGLFGFNQCMIPQPKDKGILLKDVLEKDVDEKYFLSDKMVNNLFKTSSGKDNQFKPAEALNGNDKSLCLTSRYYKQGRQDTYVTHSLQPRNGKGQGGKGHLSKTDQRSYCVDTGNSQAVEYIVAMRGKGENNEQQLEPNKENKTNALTSVQKDNLLSTQSRIRRLTPIECERLQTVPDNYTNHVSDTQRYKMLGNGWTVDVIAHILSHLFT